MTGRLAPRSMIAIAGFAVLLCPAAAGAGDHRTLIGGHGSSHRGGHYQTHSAAGVRLGDHGHHRQRSEAGFFGADSEAQPAPPFLTPDQYDDPVQRDLCPPPYHMDKWDGCQPEGWKSTGPD